MIYNIINNIINIFNSKKSYIKHNDKQTNYNKNKTIQKYLNTTCVCNDEKKLPIILQYTINRVITYNYEVIIYNYEVIIYNYVEIFMFKLSSYNQPP